MSQTVAHKSNKAIVIGEPSMMPVALTAAAANGPLVRTRSPGYITTLSTHLRLLLATTILATYQRM